MDAAPQTDTEIRLAAEIVAVAAAVRDVRDELHEDRVLRARVDDHERRIGALEKGVEIFHAGGGSPQATSSLASAPDDLSSSASSFILARSRTRCGSIVNRWAFAMAAPSGPGATGDPRAASVRRRGIHDPTDEEHGLRQYVPHEEEERPVHVGGFDSCGALIATLTPAVEAAHFRPVLVDANQPTRREKRP